MKKFLNRRNGVLLAAVLVAVAFFSFKSGDATFSENGLKMRSFLEPSGRP